MCSHSARVRPGRPGAHLARVCVQASSKALAPAGLVSFLICESDPCPADHPVSEPWDGPPPCMGTGSEAWGGGGVETVSGRRCLSTARLGLCTLCSQGRGWVWKWAPAEEGLAGYTPPPPRWQAYDSSSSEGQGQTCTRNPSRSNCKNDPRLSCPSCTLCGEAWACKALESM